MTTTDPDNAMPKSKAEAITSYICSMIVKLAFLGLLAVVAIYGCNRH